MKVEDAKRTVFPARGAGRWFSGDPAELRRQVDGDIKAADVREIKGRIVSALAPHAGYDYSGRVAGYTFRAIRDAATGESKPECVVVVGFTHRMSFPGIAVLQADAMSTPLGEAVFDAESARFMVDQSVAIQFHNAPHGGEHSAENEVPFVQASLPGVPMVVVLMGDQGLKMVSTLVECLDALNRKKRVLVVSSTDMLHDADYELVTRTDKESLAQVEKMDGRGLAARYSQSQQIFCGIGPVMVAMQFAKRQGVKQGTVLHYRNCGDDFPESRGRWVVGYGAVVFAAE